MTTSTIICLDDQTIRKIRQREDIHSVYSYFLHRLEQRQSAWDPQHREEWSLWNKLFCAGVQFGHVKLAQKISEDGNFHQWMSNKYKPRIGYTNRMNEVRYLKDI